MPRMLDHGVRPALARTVRLRWDEHAGAQMLIAPERGLLLDEVATRIVRLCDGSRTVGQIVDVLCATYDADVRAVATDLESFLTELARRGLVRL